MEEHFLARPSTSKVGTELTKFKVSVEEDRKTQPELARTERSALVG